MANTPRKMQDPTEAALSAIQDALNLRETEPSPAAAHNEAPAVEVEPVREPRRRTRAAAAVDEDLFFDNPPVPANEPGIEEPQPPRRAANDDRRLGPALQRRSAMGPYLAAGIFAVVWAGLGIALAFGYFGADVT
jgi:hypothetical protein